MNILVFIVCKKKSKKSKLIQQAEKKFKVEMDIVNILTKVHEIKKIKMLILDSDQLVLFNYSAKPLIYPDDNEIEDNLEMENLAQMKITKMITQSEKLNKDSLKECYKRILNSQENSIINKRLIEFIDYKNNFELINHKT